MAREPVSLDLLRTFHAAHRAGTLTAAARLLGLSQPTVTTRLQALEAVTIYLATRAATRTEPHIVHAWSALLLQARLW